MELSKILEEHDEKSALIDEFRELQNFLRTGSAFSHINLTMNSTSDRSYAMRAEGKVRFEIIEVLKERLKEITTELSA